MDNGNQFLGTERIGRLMRQYAVPCIISLLVGALYNKVYSLPAISSGALCDNRSDRHTRRIHGKVNPGVEPPFVRLIS